MISIYWKIIFMFPMMIIAPICGIGMSLIRDRTGDPLARPAEAQPGRHPDRLDLPGLEPQLAVT